MTDEHQAIEAGSEAHDEAWWQELKAANVRMDTYVTSMQQRMAVLEHNVAVLATVQSVPAAGERRIPFWYPDMKGFLAIGIVLIISLTVAALIFGWAPTDDKILTLLTTVVGALLVIFKDVYQYTFGSSAGSAAKDETIKQQAAVAGEKQ